MDRAFSTWFEPEARCGNHPTRAAEVACGRCGGFQCELCVDRVERTLCERCAAARLREGLPSVVRGVVWKLMLAPGFAVISAGMLAARGVTPPAMLSVWLAPIACAAVLLFTRRAVFGWLGVVISVTLLGLQGLSAADDESWRRLSDVAMLAIAPLSAIAGCVRLGASQRRMVLLLASA